MVRQVEIKKNKKQSVLGTGGHMACREADTSLAGVDRGEGSEGDVSGSIICLRLFSSFVLVSARLQCKSSIPI